MRTGPLHIAIVGKGNLGTHLFNGLLDAHAPYFIGRDLQLHSPTDVVLVCVPDDQTASVCQSLPQDALVAHTLLGLYRFKMMHGEVFFTRFTVLQKRRR